MIKRKHNSKKILVFLLILGFIGNTVSHMQITASAAGAEGDNVPGVTGSAPEQDMDQPGCICEAQCTEEAREADCPVCEADLQACGGEDSAERPDGEPSADEDVTVDEDAAADKNEDGDTDAVSGLSAKQERMPADTEPAARAATDEQVKNAWDAMTAAMVNWDEEIDLSGYNLTADDWNRIWPDVAQDNPDLFYVQSSEYFTSSDGVVQKCQFTYNPQYNQDSVVKYRAAIDKVFAEVIGSNMTDEQKATALHDYLVQHMVYDQNANNNLGIEKRNAYEALVNGIGVCQGYTLAYAALLKKAGIEVDYCKSKSMNHIWNYVKLDGRWYHADLTYDDATASSQVGETGYVKHTYFLLSDSAMQNAKHNWDANDITCNDTRYDNSWHKTVPLQESAIYTVGGASYYLKGSTVEGAPSTIYRGASLIKRDSGGTESIVGSFEIENLGNGWPMYSMSFSRLSCSKGVLYFNVGNSVYAFDPSKDTAPEKIYQYEDADKRIVTGLLVNGNMMTLEIYNTSTNKIDDKISVPITEEPEGPEEPEDENIFKTEVENGISKIPDSFKDKENLNTPEKIEQEMKLKLRDKVSGIEETNVAVYDVKLMVNVNGTGWQEVTKDDFPSDGLTVTLPYPAGTGKDTHDFAAAHMFTADMNGFQAGDIEYPDVAKTEKGIEFKVKGLSPIAIGWKEVKDDSNGGSDNNGNGDNNGSGGNNGNVDNNGSGGNGNGNNGGNDNNGSDNNGGNNNNGSNNGNNGSNGGSNVSGNGNSNGSNTNNGTGSGSSANNGNNNNGNASVRSVTKAPVTGDSAPIMLYVLLTAAAFGMVLGGYIRMRRKSC